MSRTNPRSSSSSSSSKLEVDTSTLCGAITTGNKQLVQQLIESGVDVNQRSPDGYVPLCIAAFWGYADIAKLLLEAKADVNAANKGTGWTAAHCASFQGHGPVLLHLIQYKPNLMLEDSLGRTAVDFASTQDSIWSYFSVLKYKKSSKERLLALNIIKKVTDDEEQASEIGGIKPTKRLAMFSRPGSSYVLSDTITSSRTNIGDKAFAAAKNYGDVLYEEN